MSIFSIEFGLLSGSITVVTRFRIRPNVKVLAELTVKQLLNKTYSFNETINDEQYYEHRLNAKASILLIQ